MEWCYTESVIINLFVPKQHDVSYYINFPLFKNQKSQTTFNFRNGLLKNKNTFSPRSIFFFLKKKGIFTSLMYYKDTLLKQIQNPFKRSGFEKMKHIYPTLFFPSAATINPRQNPWRTLKRNWQQQEEKQKSELCFLKINMSLFFLLPSRRQLKTQTFVLNNDG